MYAFQIPRWIGALSLVITAIAAGPGYAAPGPPLDQIAIQDGSCRQLVVGKYDFSQACKGRMVQEVFLSHRLNFTFSLTKGSSLTFSGIAPQTKINADTAIQAVDTVMFDPDLGLPVPVEQAKGQCRYSNPYKGTRTTTTCTATTKEGTYTAEFVSDGDVPTIRKFSK